MSMLLRINDNIIIQPEYIELIRSIGKDKTEIIFNSGVGHELNIGCSEFARLLEKKVPIVGIND